jgi:hypothetical protein
MFFDIDFQAGLIPGKVAAHQRCQIEKLDENMHKQVVHIQSLILENSRLNIKLLPENTEKSKQW